jgi:DNA polymerase-3 subunit alpha
VAYALKITDLDPLPYNLLFERFLNPERVSMPDFDIDFCMDRRDEVIDYVHASTARARQPDHHLRHHGRQGGGARRGPRARLPYGLVRRHLQADPEHPGHPPEDALGKGKEGPSSEMASAELIQRSRPRTMSAT